MIKTQAVLKHYPPLIARCEKLAAEALRIKNFSAVRYWRGRRNRYRREYIALLATIREN